MTLLAAIEHAWAAGDSSVGLGTGRQSYKGRFTQDAEELDWMTLVPARALASPRAWAGVGPSIVTNAGRDRIPPATRARLRALVSRGPGEEQP